MADRQEQFTTPEEEIRMLEKKLEAKKQELSQKGQEAPHEKEMLREVLKEHIEEARQVPPEHPQPVPSAGIGHGLGDDLKKKADDLKQQEKREEQVRSLVELALTRSIHDAVKVAGHATPYLLDELHDHLVDDYYEKLVALKKIKQL